MNSNKKIMLFINLFVLSITCLAQNKNICGEVYYNQIKKLDIVLNQTFLMKFDNDKSYSEEINIKSSTDQQRNETSENGSTQTTLIGNENMKSTFFYNTKKEFFFRDIFFNETLLVKEDNYKLNWNLLEKTKKIGQFTCQKATTKFRGRNYIAWFTNEIPVPFGPWKFKGLPGLILEVYDEDKVFYIAANKIKAGKTTDCSMNINDHSLKKAITIKTYLIRKEKIIDNMFAELSSKMPKGTPALKRDKNCEDCKNDIEIFNIK